MLKTALGCQVSDDDLRQNSVGFLKDICRRGVRDDRAFPINPSFCWIRLIIWKVRLFV